MPALTGPCQSPEESAGSTSDWRLSQSVTPGEGESGLLEKYETFSPAQLAPEAWHQQDDEFQRSAVLVGFPLGLKKGTVRWKFCDESFPNVADASEIMCKVSCSNCVTYDVNNCAHPLVVLVLCVFGTCRAFLVPTEGFSHMLSSC